MTPDEIVGAWRLAQATEHDTGVDGEPVVAHPFGENPRGLILYTPDGYVSAVITTATDDNLPSVYAGTFEVTDAGLVHDVEVGLEPAGSGTVQHRGARLVDGDLWLSAAMAEGHEIRLRWVRATR